MKTLTLTMHPASEGDALELKWGDGAASSRALIDLGRENDFRALKQRGIAAGPVELFVMTHVDADHIAGAIPMVAEATAPFAPGEVWFNAYRHLLAAKLRLPADDREPLGVEQGEKLSTGIAKFAWPWNGKFAGGIVSVDSPEAARLLKLKGLSMRLLSPTDAGLAKLEPTWRTFLKDAGLLPEQQGDAPETPIDDDRESLAMLDVEDLAAADFDEDRATPNGTSIAFLASYGRKSVLFGADAHPRVLEASLRGLDHSETKRLKVSLYKVSHHGSRANTSRSLLKLLDCQRFAFSSDGTRNGHPHPEAIARILVNDRERMKTLYFNFRQEHALVWENEDLKAAWNYECVFPPEGQEGLEIAI